MAKDGWSSELGFILASIGSAVGLGNIWRFPYLASEHGNLAFVVVYLIGICLIGLPFMLAEILTGSKEKKDAFAFLKSFYSSHGLKIALLVAITLIGIMSYYLIITGWTLAYAIKAPFGDYPEIGSFRWTWLPLACYAASLAICVAAVNKGIRNGIEKLNAVMIPLLFIAMALLAAYALFMYGFRGIEPFMQIEPKFLLSAETWAAALSQVFFSLSLGMGVMITYASYKAREGNPLSESLRISVPDTLVALTASFIIFSFLFSNGMAVKEGGTLSFETLPAIFQAVPYGNIVALGFYSALFMAAITSAVSMLQIAVQIIEDALGRGKAQAIVFAVVLIVALSAMQIYGILTIELVDRIFGFGLLLLCGAFFSYALSFSVERAKKYAITVPLLRYVIPAVLLLLLAFAAYRGLCDRIYL